MDRFLSMQAFVRVADTGSFAEAARSLQLSTSVISERVRQLERLLRVQLLHRTTRCVRLSEAGTTYYEECHDIVSRMDDLENRMSGASGRLAGKLKVACSMDLGVSHVGPAVSEFALLHPELVVDLVVGNRIVRPIDGGFSAVVHLRHPDSGSVIQRVLAPIDSVYCASPGYLARSPKLNKPADLHAHRCINYSFQPNGNEWIFYRGGREMRLNVPVAIQTSTSAVQRTFALDGHGVAIIPVYRIAADLASGALVRVLEAWSATRLQLSAAYPAAHRRTRKLRALLDFLARRLEDLPRLDEPAPAKSAARSASRGRSRTASRRPI